MRNCGIYRRGPKQDAHNIVCWPIGLCATRFALGTYSVCGAGRLRELAEFSTVVSAGERRVVVPFVESLVELVLTIAVRQRRDFSALLTLIWSHHSFIELRATATRPVPPLPGRGLCGRPRARGRLFSEGAKQRFRPRFGRPPMPSRRSRKTRYRSATSPQSSRCTRAPRVAGCGMRRPWLYRQPGEP